ncbi:MAG: energy transducer TonB family protein [Xanthobacteraceae bacterium]
MTLGRRLWRPLTALTILWAVSATIVLAVHGGLVAAAIWSRVIEPSGGAAAIIIDLAPLSDTSAAAQANLPIAPPEKIQPEPEDKLEPEKEEAKVEEKTEPPPPQPPPPDRAEVTLPREPPPPEKKPPPKKKIATAVERSENVAPRQKALNTGVASVNPNSMRTYAASIIRPHILRFYNFPESARSKGEHGSVVVSFSITRNGKLISRQIAKSSGHSELDNEALATLQRAQPYPPPPPDLTDQQFTFSLPMNYNMR